MQKCVVLVDNSNVFIEGQKYSARIKGVTSLTPTGQRCHISHSHRAVSTRPLMANQFRWPSEISGRWERNPCRHFSRLQAPKER